MIKKRYFYLRSANWVSMEALLDKIGSSKQIKPSLRATHILESPNRTFVCISEIRELLTFQNETSHLNGDKECLEVTNNFYNSEIQLSFRFYNCGIYTILRRKRLDNVPFLFSLLPYLIWELFWRAEVHCFAKKLSNNNSAKLK